ELAETVAPADAVFLDAKVEAELLELDDEEAVAELLESVGQDEPGLNALARAGFHTLGLQTYLTAGPKEARAWTIPQGATAPQAAGVIHTDFERGFIKAEVVSYDDLMAAGSMADARAAGKVRMEGKEYVMHDGDVVEFRFNVCARASCACDVCLNSLRKWPPSACRDVRLLIRPDRCRAGKLADARAVRATGHDRSSVRAQGRS